MYMYFMGKCTKIHDILSEIENLKLDNKKLIDYEIDVNKLTNEEIVENIKDHIVIKFLIYEYDSDIEGEEYKLLKDIYGNLSLFKITYEEIPIVNMEDFSLYNIKTANMKVDYHFEGVYDDYERNPNRAIEEISELINIGDYIKN